MLSDLWTQFGDLIDRGGWVMYPLLALSIGGVALVFERCWFWMAMNHPGRLHKYRRVARFLRAGQTEQVRALVEGDRSVYGQLVRQMIDEATTDAAVTDAVESQRPRMERFMPTLGTIITAAPMLGILGTVTGIIASFRILSETETVTDPARIGAGIAEALLTTVAGLVVALIVLFPFNAFRAQIDRTLGRMESLVAAARRQPADDGAPPAERRTP